MKHFGRPVVQLALVLTLATGMGACSTMADLDPTGLLGDDDSAPLPADAPPTAQNDSDVTTPDLSALPAKPATASASQQAQTAQAVNTAGTQAQYSGDALRAGTEAAAPPPGPAGQTVVASATPPTAQGAVSDTPPSAEDAPPSAAPPPAAPAQAAPPAAAPAARPTVVASAAPPPVQQTPAQQAPIQQAAPVAAPAATASAMAPPPGAEPAVPAVPPAGSRGAMTAMAQPSDAALGFKPSTAPALNPSINQWVSAPILAHYRETAAVAGTAGTAPAVPAIGGRKGMGGPAMSGDVVANMDAAAGTPAGMSAAMNGGVPPTEIIYFPGDGTSLSAKAAAQVRDAVSAYKASGGGATIKVVGHASSRTTNMPVEKHLEAIFNKSQTRANVVAQALIKAGIPASRVIVQAVGDSQPVYYESMPQGEEGNRRAEIFVQG